MPFMNQTFYKILLLVMVSLAVGVLSGSGVFHLIPHVSICGKYSIQYRNFSIYITAGLQIIIIFFYKPATGQARDKL